MLREPSSRAARAVYARLRRGDFELNVEVLVEGLTRDLQERAQIADSKQDYEN